jgi:hypothetical protein
MHWFPNRHRTIFNQVAILWIRTNISPIILNITKCHWFVFENKYRMLLNKMVIFWIRTNISPIILNTENKCNSFVFCYCRFRSSLSLLYIDIYVWSLFFSTSDQRITGTYSYIEREEKTQRQNIEKDEEKKNDI